MTETFYSDQLTEVDCGKVIEIFDKPYEVVCVTPAGDNFLIEVCEWVSDDILDATIIG